MESRVTQSQQVSSLYLEMLPNKGTPQNPVTLVTLHRTSWDRKYGSVEAVLATDEGSPAFKSLDAT